MPGPPPKTTSEQRQRVLELVEAGRSYSAVAAEVFGDERYRGRVERIVRGKREGRSELPSLEELLALVEADAGERGELGDAESWLEQLVPLYGAALKRRLEADVLVSCWRSRSWSGGWRIRGR